MDADTAWKLLYHALPADATVMFLTPDPRVLAPRLREYLQTASATPE